jgi:tRNA threonylcarbamoyladenosine biosynthesis protein TsaB
MRVLALDTATEGCSVALLTDAGLTGAFEEMGRGHAEKILGMLDAVLRDAGLALGMLDGIAASVGPGAFTGIRISVSVAQGLAFGANLPVVPVSTLEALALQAMRGGAVEVMACLDARMGEIYWGCFRADAEHGLTPCGPAAVGPPEAAAAPFAGPFHGIGRGFGAYPALGALAGVILTPAARTALPDARDMARLGAIRLSAGHGLDAAQLVPLYLRDQVALTEAERASLKRPAV